MLHNCQQEKVTVVKLGHLDYGAVSQALDFANQIQRAFYFDFIETELPLDDKYKLPNGGYDFDAVGKQFLKIRAYKQLSRPLILMTAEPIGDTEHSTEPGWFYFSAGEEAYDPKVSIISTQPLAELPKTRTLQDYLFMMLSTYILSNYANLAFHKDIRGCFLDYCGDELSDAEHSLVVGRLCHDCEQELQNRMRQNKVSLEMVASAMKLMNRSASRKHCFVVMPFKNKLASTYEIIRQALVELGWEVKRSDEIAFPRLITTQILKEILVNDLVIADLTRGNPNVFYELGLAHALGNDVILLSQTKIPFDLKNELTIFYKPSDPDKLKSDLKRAVTVEPNRGKQESSLKS
jgi:hypothetical protein